MFDLEINEYFGRCILHTEGSRKRIVESAQQLAWIGAAFRSSDTHTIQCSEVLIAHSRFNGFVISYSNRPLSKARTDCWCPLFTNAVIAGGFPIPIRSHGEFGLEIPLEIMATLCGARHAIEYQGGLLIKGFSTMLVPVEQYPGSIQWHLLKSDNGKRLPYSACSARRILLQDLDGEAMLSARAFLGWWPSAELRLGVSTANCKDIDWSAAKEIGGSAKLSGGSFGFQNMITGQLNVAFGVKDGPFRVSCQGPFESIIQCSESTQVLLYDHADKRGWLVSALCVVVHILRMRYSVLRNNKHWDLVSEKRLGLSRVATHALAMDFLKCLVFRNASMDVLEHGAVHGGKYRLQDAIADIWSLMERVMEKEEIVKATPGVQMRSTWQSSLSGWEFMALVEQRNFRRKQQTIAKTSGGWVNLVNDIDAIVLFGTGFGDIIKPIGVPGSLCEQWQSLPKGKDYLAIGCPTLEKLYAEAGSRRTREHLTSTHLQWQQGPVLFEPCMTGSNQHCKCDRLQQLIYDSPTTIGHVSYPKELANNGCVIFGQSHHRLKSKGRLALRMNAVHILPNVPLEDLNQEHSATSVFSSDASPVSSGSSQGYNSLDDARPSSLSGEIPEGDPDNVVQEPHVAASRGSGQDLEDPGGNGIASPRKSEKRSRSSEENGWSLIEETIYQTGKRRRRGSNPSHCDLAQTTYHDKVNHEFEPSPMSSTQATERSQGRNGVKGLRHTSKIEHWNHGNRCGCEYCGIRQSENESSSRHAPNLGLESSDRPERQLV